MESPKEKSRAPPRNSRQYDYLVDFMSENKHIALNKFGNTYHDKEDINKGWETLVKQLNELGPSKPRESWEKTWKDSKSNAAKKAAALRKARARTGNEEIPEKMSLNDNDNKIIGILGADYVNGSAACADSTPESDEALRGLMDGEDVACLDVEKTIEEPSMMVAMEDGMQFDLDSGSRGIYNTAVNSFIREGEPGCSSQICGTPAPQSTPQLRPNAVLGRERRQLEAEIEPKQPSRLRSKNRERLGNQFREARAEFADNQRQHGDALQTCAEALKKIAENDSRRLEVEAERVNVERERVAVFKGFVQMMEKFLETQKKD